MGMPRGEEWSLRKVNNEIHSSHPSGASPFPASPRGYEKTVGTLQENINTTTVILGAFSKTIYMYFFLSFISTSTSSHKQHWLFATKEQSSTVSLQDSRRRNKSFKMTCPLVVCLHCLSASDWVVCMQQFVSTRYKKATQTLVQGN